MSNWNIFTDDKMNKSYFDLHVGQWTVSLSPTSSSTVQNFRCTNPEHSSHWAHVTILSAKFNLSPAGWSFPQMILLSSSLVSKESSKSSTRLFILCRLLRWCFPLGWSFLWPLSSHLSGVFICTGGRWMWLLISSRFIIRWLKWFMFVGLTVGRCGWLC